MGNLTDVLAERATDPDYLQTVVDLIHRGFTVLDAAQPDVKVDRTCVLPDGADSEDCATHEHEAPTIVLREASTPYTWRFWPEPEHGVWLAEFESFFDPPGQASPVFHPGEYDQAPPLTSDADFIALWIVALAGPEV